MDSYEAEEQLLAALAQMSDDELLVEVKRPDLVHNDFTLLLSEVKARGLLRAYKSVHRRRNRAPTPLPFAGAGSRTEPASRRL